MWGNERTGWDWSQEGLPPLEEEQQQQDSHSLSSRRSRAIRFQSGGVGPSSQRPPPGRANPAAPRFPSLQRRTSLLAYEPIIVRFVKNGDKFFEGVRVNITQKTMRSWDNLLAELSRRIDLPAGVRHVYTPEKGHRVKSLSQLEHKKTYVCASSEPFKKINYDGVKNPDWKTSNKLKTSDAGLFANIFPLSPFDPSMSLGASMRSELDPNSSIRSWTESGLDSSAMERRISRRKRLSCLNSTSELPAASSFPPPRRDLRRVTIQSPSSEPSTAPLVLTIINNTPFPRQTTSIYINKNAIKSWEEVKLLIGENQKAVNGCLRLFSLAGEEVQSLSQLWRAGNTLIAAGNEKFDIIEFLKGGAPEEAVTAGGTTDNPSPRGPLGLTSATPPTTDKGPDMTSHFPQSLLESADGLAKPEEEEEDAKPTAGDGSTERLEQKPEALVESNSEPSITARETNAAHGSPDKEMSSVEPNTSSDMDKPEGEAEESRKKAEVGFISDSSGEGTSYHVLQDSPLSANYLQFPPTPISDVTPGGLRPRPKRLSSMFEDIIRPMSLSSSPPESPLLHSKHKKSRSKSLTAGLLLPQSPHSEVSLGAIPSVVDMIVSGGQKTFPQSNSSTDSNFSLSVGSQPVVKSRNVAIQTNFVDDHLSTTVEPEAAFMGDRSQLNSRENVLSQTEGSTTQDILEASSAAASLYKHTRDRYYIGMPIAEGNFATIKNCTDKDENKEFLLRVIQKAKVFGKDDKLLREIEIMRMIRHENVLTVQDYWESMNEVCMVMESIEGGDLFDAILYCQHFSEADAMEAMRQLGLALVYLHANRIVHRGIKPENIFLSLEMDGSWTLKITGFSLATKMSEPLTLVCGNQYYRAPEMEMEQGYGTKADVWSAGIIAYILLSGIMPFRRRKKSRATNSQYSKLTFPSSYWENVSSDAMDFICHLLVVSPQDRYSSSHLMQHCWLKKSFREGLSKKLVEYLNNKAAIKVAPVPILTVTALDHESHYKKTNNKNNKTNQVD